MVYVQRLLVLETPAPAMSYGCKSNEGLMGLYDPKAGAAARRASASCRDRLSVHEQGLAAPACR